MRKTLVALFILGMLATCLAEVNILLLVPNRYGANYNFNRDQYERMGWRVTTAAVTDMVTPCYGGLPYLSVDTLIQEIGDLGDIDALAIMTATWRYQTDPYGDLIDSPECTELLTEAVDSLKPLFSPCVSPRVLAAADLLDGVEMQGEPGYSDEYLAEYLAAGAIYLGNHLPPVICGSIVTATRGQYYQMENAQAIGAILRGPSGNVCPIVSKSCPMSVEVLSQDGTVWSRTLDGGGSEGARDLLETDQGDLVVTGYTFSAGDGDSDMLLVKTDSDGNVSWSKAYGGSGWEYANCVCETDDGGYLLAGTTTTEGQGLQDMMVLRADGSGNMLWYRTFGTAGMDAGLSVTETASGEVLVSGYREMGGAQESDLYLVRLDSDGNTLWEKTFGGQGPENGDHVVETPNGDILVAGCTGSETLNMDALLVKFDSDGNLLWSNYYQGSGGEEGYDRGHSLCLLSDGSIAIIGDSNELNNCSAMFLLADPLGNELRKEFFGYNFYDYGNEMIATSDGGYIICGASKDYPSCRNFILAVKVHPDSGYVWRERLGPVSGSSWGSSIAGTLDGNYVIAGQTVESEDYDIILIKIEDETLGIGQPQAVQPEIMISPNPVSGSAAVQVPGYKDTCGFVYDSMGRLVQRFSGGNMDVSNLPPGRYAACVPNGESTASAWFTVID